MRQCIRFVACATLLLLCAVLSPHSSLLPTASAERVSIKINRPVPTSASSYASSSSYASAITPSSSPTNPLATAAHAPGSFWSSMSLDAAWPEATPTSWTPPGAAPFSLPPPPPKRQYDEPDTSSDPSKTKDAETERPLLLPPASDDAWRALLDICVEHEVAKYTYRVCPFRNVSQWIGEEGPEFNLGVWHSWHYDSGREEVSMRYTGGAPCEGEGGKPRQTELFLRCIRYADNVQTDTSQIAANDSAVSSPSRELLPDSALFLRRVLEGHRCSYSARLYTPLVCSRGYRTSKRERQRREEEAQRRLQESLRHGELERGNRSSSSSSTHAHLSSTSTLALTLRLQRRSHSLGQRIAFHATVSAMESCIRTLNGVLTSSMTASTPSMHKLQTKQQQQAIQAACQRFKQG